MNESVNRTPDGMGVDLKRALTVLWQKSLQIIAFSILSAVVALLATRFLVTPQYESRALFYVNNNNFSLGSTSVSISSGDISASKSLVDSYIVILNTRESLNEVIEYAQVDLTHQELEKMITASAVNSTEIFEVIVTSSDPAEAERLANAIAVVLPERIAGIIENTSAKVVEHAVIASQPSAPSYVMNTMIGFLFGFVLIVMVLLLREMFNITIRSEEDIAQVCAYPMLASVPDMAAPSKGGYYGYGSKKKKPAAHGNAAPKSGLIGDGLKNNFAAAESYKLLRTKLQFSFTDEKNCRVIGVSSALSGEGKSLSAVNLAYTLSQLDKRVMLIDCDMRKPTLAEKLSVRKYPGLSGFLTSQNKLKEVIQFYSFEEGKSINLITAGENPPNPVELLSSPRMALFLEELHTHYDYVILDLPPVSEVSDALAVAKQTDGILLVVRQNHCDRPVLEDTVQQFEFVGAKILGVVYNCATEEGHKYGKGYYKRYGQRYGYEAANRSGRKARRE